MSAPLVLSLCDATGNIVRPWAEAGYDCLCLDLTHSIRADRTEGRITYRWADVRSVTPADTGATPVMIFAAPPCTHLAVSGARDFARKGLRALIDALEIVEACRKLCEWYGCPWMLENPVSRLSTCWRKPDHTFDPCDYGDPYTKRTCLWTGGGFVMPPKRPVAATEGSKMHLMAPSADRAALRSATPMGFARAVFQANAPAHVVEAVA
ncbi:MAG TPA: hypothetical protein VFK04_12810 [Gemmatimonadaceae bacterium]|nr:hypothetical protein [Gemmatimonadaceae bacterium]